MKKSITSIVAIIVAACASAFAQQNNPNNPTVENPTGNTFTENRGQLLRTDGTPATDILYYTSAGTTTDYFSSNKVSHVWNHIDTTAHTSDMYRMDMEFAGSSSSARTTGKDNSQGYMNFFLGHIPDGIVNVPTWQEITYTDIYANTDVTFRNQGASLAFGFTI